MPQHNGTAQAFESGFNHGLVKRDLGACEVIPFEASQVEGLRSLGKGETSVLQLGPRKLRKSCVRSSPAYWQSRLPTRTWGGLYS